MSFSSIHDSAQQHMAAPWPLKYAVLLDPLRSVPFSSTAHETYLGVRLEVAEVGHTHEANIPLPNGLQRKTQRTGRKKEMSAGGASETQQG